MSSDVAESRVARPAGRWSPRSAAQLARMERDEEVVRRRIDGLTLRQIGAEFGLSHTAVAKAIDRHLAWRQSETGEADRLRALESERLDAAAQALWPKVAAGEERSQEVWLKNRTRFAALNGIDMRPEQHEAPMVVHVNTALPPEVLRGEVVDEYGPGELEAGEAG